jgi:hypothetical protein
VSHFELDCSPCVHKHKVTIKLRRLRLDMNLTRNEARIMGGVFTPVTWKLGQKLSTTCQM